MKFSYTNRVFRPDSQAKNVYVTGTFDNWSKTIALKKKDDVFTATVPLNLGSKIVFKFVVDDQWVVSEDEEKETDDQGFLNNILSEETLLALDTTHSTSSSPKLKQYLSRTTETSTFTAVSFLDSDDQYEHVPDHLESFGQIASEISPIADDSSMQATLSGSDESRLPSEQVSVSTSPEVSSLITRVRKLFRY
ncbi:BA75_00577T0 [Komagataella pastoris]|uniref:BA75_00577T0 n=1 Tax=Komagataella pastoris TaxID=4922 RepID=A0A1B2J6F4_PICPA|nr:BA75_00577T0 [Komagataella pastoris]